jgi:uncharacterized membrane protein
MRRIIMLFALAAIVTAMTVVSAGSALAEPIEVVGVEHERTCVTAAGQDRCVAGGEASVTAEAPELEEEEE